MIDKGNTKKTVSEKVDPRSEKSYLRLIGVLARKLEEVGDLDPDPSRASSQVLDMAMAMQFDSNVPPIGERQQQAVKSKLALAAEVLSNPSLSVPDCKKRLKMK